MTWEILGHPLWLPRSCSSNFSSRCQSPLLRVSIFEGLEHLSHWHRQSGPQAEGISGQTSRRVVYRTRVFNVCSVRHWFYTTNHSGFASPWKFNFLKKYARTFNWKCKKPQRQSLFFCAKCSWQCLQWAWTGFCGNCFPISTAKSRWKSVPCTLFVSMCISQDPWRALRSKLISRFWYKSLMRKCKTTYTSVASYMWGSARRHAVA